MTLAFYSLSLIFIASSKRINSLLQFFSLYQHFLYHGIKGFCITLNRLLSILISRLKTISYFDHLIFHKIHFFQYFLLLFLWFCQFGVHHIFCILYTTLHFPYFFSKGFQFIFEDLFIRLVMLIHSNFETIQWLNKGLLIIFKGFPSEISIDILLLQDFLKLFYFLLKIIASATIFWYSFFTLYFL